MFEDMRTDQVPVSGGDGGYIDRNHRDVVFRPKEHGGLAESFSGAFGILDTVRNFVRENEEWLIIAVAVLLLLDCDDNIELIIAAGIILYPLLKK